MDNYFIIIQIARSWVVDHENGPTTEIPDKDVESLSLTYLSLRNNPFVKDQDPLLSFGMKVKTLEEVRLGMRLLLHKQSDLYLYRRK